MKHSLLPLLLAGALLADVAPGGCGKRSERPLPPVQTPPPAETTTAPAQTTSAPTDDIPAPPAF